MIEKIHWLGHDSFKIIASKTIYIDPFQITEQKEKADIVLITHEHFDHFSKEDIKKISKKETVVVGTVQCKKEMPSIVTMKPGEKKEVSGLKIEAVPAYNVNKFREAGKVFHPKEDQKLGYIIEIDECRIYHAGDTDFVPEMKQLKSIDIALLPVSGTYVMTAEEAAEAANAINPKIAVPMHYGSIVGTKKDAEKFRQLFKGETIIMEKE